MVRLFLCQKGVYEAFGVFCVQGVGVGFGGDKEVFARENVVLGILRKQLHKVVGIVAAGHHPKMFPVKRLPCAPVEAVKIRMDSNPVFKLERIFVMVRNIFLIQQVRN